MDYVIIVNDNGELKTVSATEIAAQGKLQAEDGAYDGPLIYDHMAQVLNTILDARSAAESLTRAESTLEQMAKDREIAGDREIVGAERDAWLKRNGY